MRRVRQTLEDVLAALRPVDAEWLDRHAETAIEILRELPEKPAYQRDDVIALLQSSLENRTFEEALTVVRLFLELSKDEFRHRFKESSKIGFGVTGFKRDKEAFVDALVNLGLLEKMVEVVNRPVRWSDILVERLKGGRGSAIKGQQRGRGMEDFVEEIILRVFPGNRVQARCRFVGSNGTSTEKADFAIPNAEDPRVLIEVKAYGATGSKQTDVLGDISRIVAEKRHDTLLLLVTDGVTWKERSSDLRKLVQLQNEGKIGKIYTKLMAAELESDLREIKTEAGL